MSEHCGPVRLGVYQIVNALSLQTSTASALLPGPTAPSIKPIVGVYLYMGCQTEAVGTRTLTGATFVSDTMTWRSVKKTVLNSDILERSMDVNVSRSVALKIYRQPI